MYEHTTQPDSAEIIGILNAVLATARQSASAWPGVAMTSPRPRTHSPTRAGADLPKWSSTRRRGGGSPAGHRPGLQALVRRLLRGRGT